MKCRTCGAENPDHATRCSVCTNPLRKQTTQPSESFKRTTEFHPRVQSMVPKSKTLLPTGAGGILILNGVASLSGLLVANAFVSVFFPEASDAMLPVTLVFGAIALFVVAAGVLAMMRRAWVVCLIACIAAFPLTLMFGFLCGIVGAFLSIAAFVLLLLSRDEFGR